MTYRRNSYAERMKWMEAQTSLILKRPTYGNTDGRWILDTNDGNWEGPTFAAVIDQAMAAGATAGKGKDG